MTAVFPRRLLAEAPGSAIFVVVGARSSVARSAPSRARGISGGIAGRRLQGANLPNEGGSDHG
jgi:hypothetical protein